MTEAAQPGTPGETRPATKKKHLHFWEFFSRWFVVFTGIDLPVKEAHRAICEAIELLFLGELYAPSGKRAQFLLITQPPRTGKTKLIEAFVCWAWGQFPNCQWLYTSYASSLAEQSSNYISGVIESRWYRRLFPDARPGPVQRGDHITTNQGGQLFAEGVGGSLLGKGGGLKHPAGGMILADDLAKPDEILSQVQADAVNFWLENGLKSRRNSSEWCPIVICAQRLGENDPPGYVLEHYREVTVHIKVPQIAADGTNNFPETRTIEDCERTKAANPFAYWAQLQQEPIILGGNLIKVDDFVEVDVSEATLFERLIITADTALEDDQDNDDSALELWGLLHHNAVLIDLAYGKWESPELLSSAVEFWNKHHRPDNRLGPGRPVSKFTVEKKASGHGLIQQLNRLGIPAEGIERTKDKVTRVQEVLPYIATGKVQINHALRHKAAFVAQCAQFRKDGKQPEDDMVDAMCDGIWQLLGGPVSILDTMGRGNHKSFSR